MSLERIHRRIAEDVIRFLRSTKGFFLAQIADAGGGVR